MFNTEIQDGRQKWWENNFCEKSPVDCRYHAGQKFRRNSSISHSFRDKLIFAFNTKIQDGCQKWRENNFCKKSCSSPADTLWVKNFVKIALSHSVSKINTFLHLTQEFKMAAKKWLENNFCKQSPVDLQIPWGSKISSKSLNLGPFPR